MAHEDKVLTAASVAFIFLLLVWGSAWFATQMALHAFPTVFHVLDPASHLARLLFLQKYGLEEVPLWFHGFEVWRLYPPLVLLSYALIRAGLDAYQVYAITTLAPIWVLFLLFLWRREWGWLIAALTAFLVWGLGVSCILWGRWAHISAAALSILAIYAYRRGHPYASAALLFVASLVQPTHLLLVLLLIVMMEWRRVLSLRGESLAVIFVPLLGVLVSAAVIGVDGPLPLRICIATFRGVVLSLLFLGIVWTTTRRLPPELLSLLLLSVAGWLLPPSVLPLVLGPFVVVVGNDLGFYAVFFGLLRLWDQNRRLASLLSIFLLLPTLLYFAGVPTPLCMLARISCTLPSTWSDAAVEQGLVSSVGDCNSVLVLYREGNAWVPAVSYMAYLSGVHGVRTPYGWIAELVPEDIRADTEAIIASLDANKPLRSRFHDCVLLVRGSRVSRIVVSAPTSTHGQ